MIPRPFARMNQGCSPMAFGHTHETVKCSSCTLQSSAGGKVILYRLMSCMGRFESFLCGAFGRTLVLVWVPALSALEERRLDGGCVHRSRSGEAQHPQALAERSVEVGPCTCQGHCLSKKTVHTSPCNEAAAQDVW